MARLLQVGADSTQASPPSCRCAALARPSAAAAAASGRRCRRRPRRAGSPSIGPPSVGGSPSSTS
eukprot:6980439-Pyramimonas_sp.AAC.1